MLLPRLKRTRERLARSVRKRVGRYHRRSRLYCLGTPKTGTHSVAEMFTFPVRCDHEPDSSPMMEKIMDSASGRISPQEYATWLRLRDQRLRLDVDSSTLNFFIIDFLKDEYPDARFLLTIRDCYSWLNSMAKHAMRYTQEHWRPFRDFRFKPYLYRHRPEDRVFEENGLHSAEGYLAYWAMHNGQAIGKIPAERLLIIRTDQISARANEIASFAGLDPKWIDAAHTHEFQNPGKRNILQEIDSAYLEKLVQKHCAGLMAGFFPEIKSLDDAKL